MCGQGDESGTATDIERFESVVGNSGQNADLQSLFSVDVLLVSPCNTGQRKSAPAGTRTRALGLGNRCSIRLSYRGVQSTKPFRACRPLRSRGAIQAYVHGGVLIRAWPKTSYATPAGTLWAAMSEAAP